MSKPLPRKAFKSLPGCLIALKLSVFFLIHLVSTPAAAQETISRAYVIKAGFIYNFTRFVKWPPRPDSEDKNYKYKICVLGNNPFGSILDRLEEKHRNKDHPLEIDTDVSLNGFQDCHILFVSFSERFNIEQIVEKARNYPVLTVGDTQGYAERGIDINLVVVQNRVNLEISKQCLDAKGFKASSELLDLATIVGGGACQ